jgi:hypothetical protein
MVRGDQQLGTVQLTTGRIRIQQQQHPPAGDLYGCLVTLNFAQRLELIHHVTFLQARNVSDSK